MSEQVNVSLIKETQDVLSKYVKKPPLNEKLLRKPPFRYLHDIVSAVIKETGFLNGVFTTEELDSNNVKDKESKIAFLNKLISTVKKITDTNVTVRAAKVVAGLEVDRTLTLLCTIGKAINEKDDTSKNATQLSEPKNSELYVTQKSDEKEKKTNEKNEGVSHESKKIPEKVNTVQRSSNQYQTQKIETRKNSLEKLDEYKKEKLTKNISQNIGKGIKVSADSDAKRAVPTKLLVKHNSISSKTTSVRRPFLRDAKQNSINAKPLQAVIKEGKEESNDTVKKKKELPEKDGKTERNNSQSTSKNKLKKEQDNVGKGKVKEDETTVKNEKSAQSSPTYEGKLEKSLVKRCESVVQRPGSARLRSRKVIYDNEPSKTTKETLEENGNDLKNVTSSSVRPRTANIPASARPGAPRIRDFGEVAVFEEPTLAVATVNVIEEGKQDSFMDDKDSFIVIETAKAPLQSIEITEVEIQQGQLVHQILKTQKELNESVATNISQNKQLQIEWKAGRQAEKDLVSAEIEKICGSIQVLTSAANPLGKLFDFLQEDVDEMQRELQHWKNVNEKLQKQQKSELKLGKTMLQPLYEQLSDIENNIEEEYLQLANIKMAVLNCDEKICRSATNNGPKIRIK